MNKIFKNYSLLFFILLIGLFVRTFRINEAPSRLTHDEMSIGYNAFSIAKTGLDEWSRRLPLSFEAFGDHKLPGYIYSVVPFISILGLNVISLKLPSIIAGLVIIIFGYLITFKITNNKKTSLFTALIIALSPWPIHISRMALESNLALAFYSGGLFFSLSIFDKKVNKEKNNQNSLIKLSLSGLLFALSSYTYIAFRLISVLTLISLLIINFKQKSDLKKIFIILISFIIFLIPLSPQLVGKSGSARFSQVSIFSDDGITAKVTEQRNFCFLQRQPLLPQLCKVFYNKYFYIAEKISKNYINFLLPTFLFIDGDKLEYLNDPDFAEFLIVLIPFYLIGLYQIANINSKKTIYILTAFLIMPISSALVGDPQIVRGSGLLLFVSIFSSIGINYILQIIKNNKLRNLSSIIFIVIFMLGFTQYFISYNYIYSAKYENYIYPLDKRTVEHINNVQDDFDIIYISNHFPDAHILLSFYNQIDPSYYQSNTIRPVPDSFGFSHPTELGKYQFGDMSWSDLLCRDSKKTLFITFNDQLPKVWKVEGYLYVIKDFSGVHTQVEFIDIGIIRQYLTEMNLIDEACLNKIN